MKINKKQDVGQYNLGSHNCRNTHTYDGLAAKERKNQKMLILYGKFIFHAISRVILSVVSISAT